MSKNLEVGHLAPEVDLPTNDNGFFSLKEINKNVVLYFYPKDDTPGCTIEAKSFGDIHQDFLEKDTIIIGVSKDDVEKHNKFKCKYNLPFMLASDVDTKVCQAYGVWQEKSMFGKKYMGIARQTFLIGKDKKIKAIWNKVTVLGHAKQVLKKMNELNIS